MKSSMKHEHEESKETPAMEAAYHSKKFLKKAAKLSEPKKVEVKRSHSKRSGKS